MLSCYLFFLAVVFFGVICMALGFAASRLGGTVIRMGITFSSAIGGPTMTMFLLGIFVPFINWQVGIFNTSQDFDYFWPV